MANINNKDSALEMAKQLLELLENMKKAADASMEMFSKDMQMYKEDFPILYKQALEDYNYNLGRYQLAVEMRNEVLQAYADTL